MYSVKEMFYTLQGEGAHAGRPAVFCRFSGCNLWSGREQDRNNAVCSFCDTDFVGTDGQNGGKFKTAIELAQRIDWICVSPKADAEVIITQGHELKLVYPQALAMPDRFDHLDFTHRYLQALDDDNQKDHLQQVVEYCMRHPRWKMSLQTHKIVGID